VRPRRRLRPQNLIAVTVIILSGAGAYGAWAVAVTRSPAAHHAPPTPSFVDGRLGDKVCKTYTVKLFGFRKLYEGDLGWVWARTILGGPQTRNATGTVTKSEVSHTDFPASHLSHDQTTDIRLDPGQEDLLSDVGLPNEEKPYLERFLKTPTTLHVEWETGLVPGAIGRGEKELYFPRWAWPSVGDSIWVDGQWIFDCGHGTPVCHIRPHCLTPRQHEKHYLTELHPLRAIASMRSQVKTIAGSHGQPVPVTATDLYIHGMAGYVYDLLNCGGHSSRRNHPYVSCQVRFDTERLHVYHPRSASSDAHGQAYQ
jgi:hypothetical protein